MLDENGKVECLRATLGTIDADTGAITYLAEIPEGKMVRITVADRGNILDGCRASIKKAFAGYPHGKKPDAALFFSCANPQRGFTTNGTSMPSTLRESLCV
jgi:hypothetical protein